MHLTEDEIALFSAFVLMSAGKKNQRKMQQFLTCPGTECLHKAQDFYMLSNICGASESGCHPYSV